MKNRIAFFLLTVVLATTASGQTQSAAKAQPSQMNQQMAQQMRQQAAPPVSTIAEVLDLQVTQVERQIMGLAEAMPESKFDFNPANLNLPDSRDPVRTFAGQLKHLATDNYAIWSPMTGDAMPPGIKDVNGPAELKTRAEILKFVKDSFALGHKAAATVNSKNALELLKFRGMNMPRQYLATFALIHTSDHAGQLAVYLRLAGVTPPGSRK